MKDKNTGTPVHIGKYFVLNILNTTKHRKEDSYHNRLFNMKSHGFSNSLDGSDRLHLMKHVDRKGIPQEQTVQSRVFLPLLPKNTIIMKPHVEKG